MKAPPILELTDDEKFVDINGNVLDIEVRGTKDMNNIYFKVVDVANKFGLGDVTTILTNNDSSFMKETHYKLFKIPQLVEPGSTSIKKGQKALFLTFKGLTKLLYVSHSKNAEHFQDWANKILFIHQLGTKEEKINLFSSTLGISAPVIKEILNTDANTLPCIYLFTLGYVKDLRESMNISMDYKDVSIVCKYGFTKDLKRRTCEHINTYNKIPNSNLKLKYYSYIDPLYISTAETDIRTFMEAFKTQVSFENQEELVIIPKELSKLVEKQYQQISKSYMGHISELINRIKELEDQNEKQMLKHQLETQQLIHQLETQQLIHQNQKEKYENQLLKKELEIMKLQIQLVK
jgi:hypothetical protein